jgi:site-specific recombinase XerD
MDTADHVANQPIDEQSAAFNLQATLALMDGAYAPNTIRAIRADVERWLNYCHSQGVGFNNASSGHFAGFIDGLTESQALRASTIRRTVSSVACCYRLQGLADLTKSPLALLALRRMNRTLGRKMRQAKPIDNHLLERLLAACPGDELMTLRNRLLLLVGHDTLLRRAELVSLQIEDIQMKADLSGARILLRRSKTDQDALGRWLPLSQRTTETLATYLACLTLEVTRLLEESPLAKLQGALFASLPLRHVSGLSQNGTASAEGGNFKIKGLHDCRVPRIIRALARKAGLSGEQIKGLSGHSLRVGAAQELARAGEAMPLIMTRGGWTKPDTVLRYIEHTTLEPSSSVLQPQNNG